MHTPTCTHQHAHTPTCTLKQIAHCCIYNNAMYSEHLYVFASLRNMTTCIKWIVYSHQYGIWPRASSGLCIHINTEYDHVHQVDCVFTSLRNMTTCIKWIVYSHHYGIWPRASSGLCIHIITEYDHVHQVDCVFASLRNCGLLTKYTNSEDSYVSSRQQTHWQENKQFWWRSSGQGFCLPQTISWNCFFNIILKSPPSRDLRNCCSTSHNTESQTPED